MVLNPVRAHAVDRPEDWKWSSYRATAGIDDALPLVTTEWLLAQFSDTRKRAFDLYRRFVVEGIAVASPWKELRGQVFLGDTSFIEQVKGSHEGIKLGPEIPRRQRETDRPELTVLFAEASSRDLRNKAI